MLTNRKTFELFQKTNFTNKQARQTMTIDIESMLNVIFVKKLWWILTYSMEFNGSYKLMTWVSIKIENTYVLLNWLSEASKTITVLSAFPVVDHWRINNSKFGEIMWKVQNV